MSSLLRVSEHELAGQAEALKFPWFRAFGLAGVASALAVLGMRLRYAVGDDTPLPGMDQLAGQLKLALGLGAAMVLTAWIFRTVLVKRLQYAIVMSLLIHVMFCLGMQFYLINGPVIPTADAGEENVPLRNMSLPEYGGMEALQVAEPEWERVTESEVAENAQQQLERQETELEANAEPDQVEHQDMVASIDTPERRDRQEQLDRAQELELQRQMLDAQTDAPEQLEDPEVTTTEIDQPELEAREMQRADFELEAEREREEIERRERERQLAAANIRARTETNPNEIDRTEVESTERSAARATAADSAAEAVRIESTADARRMTAEARAMESNRNSESALPTRQQLSRDDAPPSRSRSTAPGAVSPTRSRSASGMAGNVAPSAGGSASMQWSATGAGRNSSAADTSAQGASVAAASASGGPGLSASSAASGSSVSRGSASVPAGAARGGGAVTSTRRSRNGTASLRSGSIGRRSTAGSNARLGAAAGGSGMSGGGRRSGGMPAGGGAAGTQAEGVSVAGAASGGGSSGSVLAGGPSNSASNVGRGGGGLPSGSGRGESSVPSGTGRSGSLAARSGSGRSGLTGRTGPSAKLSGDVAGGSSASGRSGRKTAAAALPAGALAAERLGSLVNVGPQAPSAGSSSNGGGLSGPRVASGRRKSAGLPGSSRGGSSSIGRRRSSLPGGLGGSRASRRSSGGGRPKMATQGEIAGLVKRSRPGISPIKTDKISPGFSMRKPEMRREAVEKLGGNDASEAAVDRGLEWLAAHQFDNGKWSVEAMGCKDHDCKQHGAYQADSAATGLALLAFLGAGHTHRSGEHQAVVERGLKFLIANQKKNGDLFKDGSEFTWLYAHGMAAIALCEAYGMTKDPSLKGPAQGALDFIAASQHPKFGGWRYKPRFESDTSVSGWQLMALKSGEMAGLSVSQSTYNKIGMWLDSVESEKDPGTFAYHPDQQPTAAMTAEALLMRQYLGAKRSDANLMAGADFLKMRLPRNEARDAYYWYYGTQVMFHMQGEHWSDWNANLRDMLTDAQSKDGSTRGSWSPVEPTKDKWGPSGGRHYLTCLNLLMLEVYYRHLPLYIELEE